MKRSFSLILVLMLTPNLHSLFQFNYITYKNNQVAKYHCSSTSTAKWHVDVTLSSAYTVRQNNSTRSKKQNIVNQGKTILCYCLQIMQNPRVLKFQSTLYFTDIHNYFNLLIHKHLIIENICKNAWWKQKHCK